ncbi:alpha-amylase 4N-like [Sabethes cyaneus]|uniref:alpha-amylase 4N-like n=1 Tax=Sabethes cyaneus TaxID=53552 RepID=UPI00237DD666|nr:alpha-amylase 4N-like [Sabethes cyaneus]
MVAADDAIHILAQLMVRLLLLLQLSPPTAIYCQFNPHFVNPTERTAIVHLFEWTHADVETECRQYLGPSRGFGAVQLSPVNEVRILPNRSWRERYEPISYKLAGRSGDEEQFRSMVRVCNRVGVRVYVEVVLNHMAGGSGAVRGTAGSIAYPASKDFPDAPYGGADFNDACTVIESSETHEVRNCQLDDRPDLNLGLARVRQRMVDFLNKLIVMGVAGFNIRSAKHMWPYDLKTIYSKLENLSTTAGFAAGSRPFIYQDVEDLSSESLFRKDYISLGMVSEYRFAYHMGAIMFKRKPFHYMVNLGTRLGYIPREKSIVFLDDPVLQRGQPGDDDLPRIVSYKHVRLYKIALVFMMAHRYGTPVIMSSYDFKDSEAGPPIDAKGHIMPVGWNEEDQCIGGWICEHRWNVVQNMLKFRSKVIDLPVTSWVDNGQNQLAFCRGKVGFVAINAEISLSFDANVYTCLEAGIYCDIISGKVGDNECTGRTVLVDKNGRADIFISSNEEEPYVVLLSSEKLVLG